jgi:hypothetical protein
LNWLRVRISGEDRVTEVYLNQLADGRVRHRNANAIIAGYETDAYIFAVSWPRGASRATSPGQMLVVNGSYVRRDGAVILVSLSKLSMHFDFGRAGRITLDAQPAANVRVKCRADLPVGTETVPCRSGFAIIAPTKNHITEH